MYKHDKVPRESTLQCHGRFDSLLPPRPGLGPGLYISMTTQPSIVWTPYLLIYLQLLKNKLSFWRCFLLVGII